MRGANGVTVALGAGVVISLAAGFGATIIIDLLVPSILIMKVAGTAFRISYNRSCRCDHRA